MAGGLAELGLLGNQPEVWVDEQNEDFNCAPVFSHGKRGYCLSGIDISRGCYVQRQRTELLQMQKGNTAG